jgi:hypothetical protein
MKTPKAMRFDNHWPEAAKRNLIVVIQTAHIRQPCVAM